MQAALARSAPTHSALALMARETRLIRGRVPTELEGVTVAENTYRLAGDDFLLRAPDGIALAYRRGHGVTLDAPDDADPRDIALWRDGTVYAAIAAINGLMPLHASAVACEGRVFAFAGPAGAGKSTLTAALGRHGLPLFCDDTLVLDLSQPGPPVCLPGHKRLKLWEEGAALADARTGELVASDYPKRFAEPIAGTVVVSLPLAELIFLEEGQDPAIMDVPPGERIARLQDDHQTTRLFEQAGNLDRPARFARLADIAARTPMRRFARPLTPERFDETRRFMAAHIHEASR